MDKLTQDRMILAATKVGRKLARQYQITDARDCTQTGILAVLEAADKYDPAKGTPETYAVSVAYPAVARSITKSRLPVSVRWRDPEQYRGIKGIARADEQESLAVPAETRTPEAQLDRDYAGAEAAALLEGLVGDDPVRRAVVSVLLEDCGRAEAQAHAGVNYTTFGEVERALRRRVRFDPRARDCWDRLAGN
jgi:DNA-directed RNA polymerase specialized sigma24 family protein